MSQLPDPISVSNPFVSSRSSARCCCCCCCCCCPWPAAAVCRLTTVAAAGQKHRPTTADFARPTHSFFLPCLPENGAAIDPGVLPFAGPPWPVVAPSWPVSVTIGAKSPLMIMLGGGGGRKEEGRRNHGFVRGICSYFKKKIMLSEAIAQLYRVPNLFQDILWTIFELKVTW